MKTIRKIDSDGSFSLEVKRLYLPFVVEVDCEHCGKPITRDMQDEYLSYPPLGAPLEIWVYCEECDECTTRIAKLDVTLEEIKDEQKTE